MAGQRYVVSEECWSVWLGRVWIIKSLVFSFKEPLIDYHWLWVAVDMSEMVLQWHYSLVLL